VGKDKPLSEGVLPPASGVPPVLEWDELWSFVGSKAKPAWVWVALDRETQQVVACCLGDRSEESCRFLWEQVPEPWRAATCYTDFWQSYGAVIPDAQHVAGKGTGETAHVERWNNTLRQRLGQFVRKTLSFSKCDYLHQARLILFLHRYNLSCV
jgi:insertion element IS1 protein InsB